MSENPTTPPAPPAAARPASNIGDDLRALRRSRDDRMIAGVLGGLAKQLNVDPLVLRIATAVLVLFGGAGVVIYAVGWLLIPDEDAEGSIAEEVLGRVPGRSPDAGTVCLAVGLVLAALIATGGTFSSGMGIVLLMLAVAGVVMIMRRRDDDDDVPAAPADDAGYPGFPGYVPPSTNEHSSSADTTGDGPAVEDGADDGVTAADTAVGPGAGAPGADEWPAAADAPVAASSTDTSALAHASIPDSTPEPSGTGWPEGPDWGPATSALYPDVAPEPQPPEPRRGRSYLGVLTVSTVAVALGIMAIVDATWAAIPPAAYIAAALGIVGLGMLLGSWFGRSRGLIALGIVLGLALVPATLFADVDWRAEGNTTYEFTTVAALPDQPQSHGVGEVVYDLSGLTDLTGEDELALEISQSIGNLQVIVPPDVDVTLDAAVRTGNITAFDDDSAGINAQHNDTDLGSDGLGGGSLVLDLDLRLGQIEVTRP